MKISILLLALILTSCGTYHSGSAQGYRGVGDYRMPSDYSQGVDSQDISEAEESSARNQVNEDQPYRPQFPFKLVWPVEQVRINRGYRPARDPSHDGLDLGGYREMPVLAAHEGVVIYVGNQFHGYGNLVMVEYDKEWATLYGHLNSFAVRQGQIVSAGDTLGGMGRSGHATGIHLHFELLHSKIPIDPIPYLTKSVKSARRAGTRKSPLYSRRAQ